MLVFFSISILWEHICILNARLGGEIDQENVIKHKAYWCRSHWGYSKTNYPDDRRQAVPLFRYFRAGNGRFLGLAVWRNAGGGVGCRSPTRSWLRHSVSPLIFHWFSGLRSLRKRKRRLSVYPDDGFATWLESTSVHFETLYRSTGKPRPEVVSFVYHGRFQPYAHLNGSFEKKCMQKSVYITFW